MNTDGEPVVAVGDTNLFSHENLAGSEIWADNYVTFVLPVEGASVSPEGVTNNPTFVLPPHSFTNGPPRNRPDFSRREPRPDENAPSETNQSSTAANFPTSTNSEADDAASASAR